ncbi:TauD/TfdA family dioxygenase [Streptomyces sp. NBC_01261]|uniref:TauD/TfdA dioxygenase family protein n=1 Tax=unclassified Streptomyces TaxID=2593676 RepID=UPI002E29CC37|nr:MULTISPECIES: TauD/TfdA family dioxygenase [unclassified Streptomyces]
MIKVSQVTERIGALVEGVRLGGDMDDGSVADLRAALLLHKVVFVRDQHGLDDVGQVAFASRLGKVTLAHPLSPQEEGPRVLSVDSRYGKASSWHTDVTYVDRVPAISVLRAVHLTPYGGETTWANTAAAYSALPGPLRALAGRLRAVHTNIHDYAELDEVGTNVMVCEHPVVRVHPETEEHCLLLGSYAKRFIDLTNGDSRVLHQMFQERVTQLENTVRWQWREGDVAIWDNRATQHYALANYGDHPRLMHRVTVAGDVPLGLDGRRSTVHRGDSSVYSPLA